MTEPYRQADLPTEERVKDLLGRMTREEKIGQLSQIYKRGFESEAEFHAFIAAGRAGSRILADGGFSGNDGAGMNLADLNLTQKIAVEQSRLGIPLLYGRDVIYGQRTIFPIPLAQGASFNPELVEECNTCVAREGAAVGVHWTFAPMMDVARDPRWGRVIEGSGEDPYLASKMAAAAVRGFQGSDPSKPDKLVACAKHFVGYGAAEGGRDYYTSELSENTLHNVYLPSFKAAVEAGVSTVMCAFQDIGGVPATAHRELMTDLLKERWGFDGFIVSDWGSVDQLIPHGYAADGREAARLSMNAGVDMEMVSTHYDKYMSQLIDSQEVSEEKLDDAVARILRIKFWAGLFERPYTDPNLWKEVLLREDHRAKALKMAEESLVLVKNKNQVLPLSKDVRRLLVLGPFANEKRAHLGSWVLDDASDVTTSIVEGIKKVVPEADIITADTPLCDGQITFTRWHRTYGSAGIDAVVVCVGEDWRRHGESNSIAQVCLPPEQEAIINSLAGHNIPMVVVCCSGRPLPIPAAERYADALVYAWNGGIRAGDAIARVLFGQADPGGRLPMSVPKNSGQIPVYYNHKFPGKVLEFGGSYRAYVDEEFEPLYPFGYGLSYTQFAIRDLRLDAKTIDSKGQVQVQAVISNLGLRAGSTVVQLYLRDPVASTTRPVRELKGFLKLEIEAGQEQEVSFTLGPQELAHYGAERCWKVEPGLFEVYLGFDSRADLMQTFEVH